MRKLCLIPFEFRREEQSREGIARGEGWDPSISQTGAIAITKTAGTDGWVTDRQAGKGRQGRT